VPEESPPVLVRFINVRKRFGAKVIFTDLTLDIKRGETLTVMGASGIGKSVMLKMLIGLIPCDGGTILFDGRDVTQLNDEQWTDMRRRIAYLFQGAALFDSLTVGENVAYGLREQFWNKMTKSSGGSHRLSSSWGCRASKTCARATCRVA